MVTTRRQLTDVDFLRVHDAVERLIDEEHLPGASVGIVSGDDLVYAEGFGHADIEARTPHEPSLRHRIGSITKTMVGLCAMALIDEGRLSLDDLVVERLRDMVFAGDASALSVRHLMTHTGGIGEAPTVEQLRTEDMGLWSDSDELQTLAEAYPEGITIEAPPGTKWAYANHGFALLGEIIARIEGAPIDEVLRRRIFEPLGMKDSDCLDRNHERLSTGYHRPPDEDTRELLARAGRAPPDEPTVDGWNIRARFQHNPRRAAGAVQSTIPDMARYASALLRQSGGTVRPGTFGLMLRGHWCPDDRLTSIGLTFFRRPMFGRRTFGHGGSVTGGWNTQMVILPDDDLAVLLHINLVHQHFDELSDAVVHAALGVPAVRVEPRSPDVSILRSAPGVYECTMPGALTNFRVMTAHGRIQISARDGELWLHARRGRWKHGVRMLPADPSDAALFMLDADDPQPPLIALQRGTSGSVTGLRFDRLVHMVRTEQVAPWAYSPART